MGRRDAAEAVEPRCNLPVRLPRRQRKARRVGVERNRHDALIRRTRQSQPAVGATGCARMKERERPRVNSGANELSPLPAARFRAFMPLCVLLVGACSGGGRGGSSSPVPATRASQPRTPGSGAISPFLANGQAVLKALDAIEARSASRCA